MPKTKLNIIKPLLSLNELSDGDVPPTKVNNLAPGTTYAFQVRAFGKLGFSDWSASMERMCI